MSDFGAENLKALNAVNLPAPLKTIGLPTSKVSKEMTLEQMKKQGVDFESQILGTLLNQMFTNSSAQDNPLHAGQAEDTWQGLLHEEYGKIIAKNGGIGLADAVVRELLLIQTKNNSANTQNGPPT